MASVSESSNPSGESIMGKALVGALIAGAIGAAVWAAIAYNLHVEIGWIAILIGVVVGIGANAGTGGEPDEMTGYVAIAVAVLSIMVGKFAVVSMIIDEAMGGLDQPVERAEIADDLDFLISEVADDVIAEWEEQGRTVEWPEYDEEDLDLPFEPTYPKDAWAEAEARWSAMSEGEREDYIDLVVDRETARNAAFASEFGSSMKWAGFRASWGLFDIIFLLLAGAAAYKFAVGLTD